MVRALAVVMLVCVVVIPGLGRAPRPAAGAQSRPNMNMVVILLDDLDVASVAHMPAVNRLLVKQGATFSRFFATTPLCCPSRASILRGQYAHNHGVLRNTGADAGFAAFQQSGHESATMATLFDGAGYQTALIGKYLNGYAGRDDPGHIPPGWDFWASGIDHAAYGGFRYKLNVNGDLVRYGNDDEDYLTDVLAGHAQTFLAGATASDAPFLLFLAPYAPHSPSTPAPRHRGSFAGASAPRTPAFNERHIVDKPEWVRSTGRMRASRIARVDSDYRRRLASLLAVDEMIDALVRQLEQTASLDSTVIFFLSDNGYFLGEHRQPHGKDAPYDAASRVPLIVRGPGVTAEEEIDALTLNIDLLPTMLDLAGLTPPPFIDGRSLGPLLAGERRGWRRAALLEGFGKETETREGSETSTPPFRALRGENLLYVEYETGERELYNLRADPGQLSNKARAADTSVLRTLSRQLSALTTCAGESCREAENASPAGFASRPGAKLRRSQHERRRGSALPAPAGGTSFTAGAMAIAETAAPAEPLRFTVSRRQAMATRTHLRVHVASVAAPGTLVAVVERSGGGGGKRLSSVPVLAAGWVALDIGGALGDARELAIGLRSRDGADLLVSGLSSGQAPETISGETRRQRARNRAGSISAEYVRPGRERHGERRQAR